MSDGDTNNSSCFKELPQNFLVCATIHKARDLTVLNSDTFVTVCLDKILKKTTTFRNSDCPYFNEYFVFELFCSLHDILRQNVTLTAYKKTCCAKKNESIGELVIDLTTVWNQPNHSFYKKWGKLENPIGSGSGDQNYGYLQIDLSIVSKFEEPAPAIIHLRDHEQIENNLLKPVTDQLATKLKYLVNIFRGEFVLKNNYFIQISFAGQIGKINQSKNTKTPEWNEQISFYWFYPSLCETLIIQIMVNEGCSVKCVSLVEIHFSDILLQPDQSFPSLGPTYFHFYDSFNKNLYFGRVLLQLETISNFPEGSDLSRKFQLNEIKSLSENDFWSMENFNIFLCFLEVDFLNTKSSKIKIQFSCGEFISNEMELATIKYPNSRLKFGKFYGNGRPFIQLKTRFPDFRLKLEMEIDLENFCKNFQQKLSDFKVVQLKNREDLNFQRKFLLKIIIFLKENLENLKVKTFYKIYKQITQWDQVHMSSISNILTELLTELEEYPLMLKKSDENLSENLKSINKNLNKIKKKIKSIYSKRYQDKWPDLIINIFSDNTSLGIFRTNPFSFFYSQNLDCTGPLCGQRHNILFKPVSCNHSCKMCGCISGKADISCWIGTEQEMNNCIPDGWKIVSETVMEPLEKSSFKCNLYIHQGKIRPGCDKNGLCDARIDGILGKIIGTTKVIPQSLSPIWNEAHYYNQFIGLGNSITYKSNPPLIMIELFDFDSKKKSEDHIGIGYIKPVVRLLSDKSEIKLKRDPKEKIKNIFKNQTINLDSEVESFPPLLKWISIAKNGTVLSEILLSAELIETEFNDFILESVECIDDGIPMEIRPNMKQYRLEATIAGIRNAEGFPIRTIGKYKIGISFGELILKSGPSGKILGKSLYFLDPLIEGFVVTICYLKFLKVNNLNLQQLPEIFEYWPPLIIKHLNCSTAGKELTVGATMISRPEKFFVKENNFIKQIYEMDTEIEIDGIEETDNLLNEAKKNNSRFKKKFKELFNKENGTQLVPTRRQSQNEYTWWTKFYNSLENNPSKHKLTIYNSELEKQKEFNFLQDWAVPFKLLKGSSSKKEAKSNYCTLKCSIKINKIENPENYKLFQDESPSSAIEQYITVRVYIVQGINIRSMDSYGYSDSYIKIEYGTQSISDRAHYVPNQTNPIYGRRFQLNGVIPREHLLKISIFDRDEASCGDDLIGTTIIDLEDRLKSKHRAFCGISEELSSCGYNVWRNTNFPSDILTEICKKHEIKLPEFIGNIISVDGVVFEDDTKIDKSESLQERLSLTLLKNLIKIPSIGYSLVPEHVETRSLYRDDRPGIEQGKIQLWIEIFDSEVSVPSMPIDLTPQPPRLYELRVIVWNTKDVILNDTNIFGKKMSDLYVKGWLNNVDEAQTTDVHYRSLTGEGNFNWRMNFPLKFSIAEDVMVLTKKKSIYEKFDTEIKTPATLNIQIWDNDSLSGDDFLGSLCLNLSHISVPASTAKKCKLEVNEEFENLFYKKTIKGWFPFQGLLNNGKLGQTGKIELEMEVLLEEESNLNPAGLGRDAPNALDMPKRPDTSFNWFSNPLKSLQHILWPRIRKIGFYCCLIVFVIVICISILYSLPSELSSGVFNVFSNEDDI